jgi:hypothetical protein
VSRFLLVFLLVGVVALFAAPARAVDRELRVFLDCRAACDADFIRREIPFAEFVNAAADADVHVLLRSRYGGQSNEYSIELLGLGPFAGVNDELRYVADENQTKDGVRRALAQLLSLGLTRYAAHTPAGRNVRVVYDAAGRAALPPPKDPWDHWVFAFELEGSISGEERRQQFRGQPEFDADRVTEHSRIELNTDLEVQRTVLELENATVYDKRYRYEVESFVAWSLTDHWSLGKSVIFDGGTFENRRWRLRLGPALEYNVFRYADSSSRQWTFRYLLRGGAVEYIQETIFEKTEELFAEQELSTAVKFVQPWGHVSLGAGFGSFVPNIEKHRIGFDASISIELVRGIFYTFGGQFRRIHDQIHLARGEATDQEVLLAQRDLGTKYEYALSAAFKYAFGSALRGPVNPRFEGF